MENRGIFERFFGEKYPFARHLVQDTALFCLLLGCIYLMRQLVPLVFPPGETLSGILHLADSFAAILGTIGYAVWITLDLLFLILERAKKGLRRNSNEA